MKKKIILALFLILMLLFSACDRYKHNFSTEPDNQQTTQQFFDEFSSVLIRLNSANIDSVMSYYSDNYLNNGQTKQDMRNFYSSLLNYNFTSFSVTDLNLNNLDISFKISLIDSTDTLFAKQIDDVLIKYDNSYRFYGNQESQQHNTKQRVMVILFTGTRCQNCPYSESALEELKEEMPNKFSYAEFHNYFGDPLEIPICDELYGYYQLSGVPQAIFQGQTIYGHFHDETVDTYREAINHYADMEAVAFLDSLTYSIEGNILNGSIKLSFNRQDIENLKLNAIVVEKESDVLNYNQQNCRQVVLAYSSTDIQPADGYVTFTISDLPEQLPDDSQIIVWLQTMDETYNPETCKVYNVIEEDITQ